MKNPPLWLHVCLLLEPVPVDRLGQKLYADRPRTRTKVGEWCTTERSCCDRVHVFQYSRLYKMSSLVLTFVLFTEASPIIFLLYPDLWQTLISYLIMYLSRFFFIILFFPKKKLCWIFFRQTDYLWTPPPSIPVQWYFKHYFIKWKFYCKMKKFHLKVTFQNLL